MPLPIRNIRLRAFSANTLDNSSGSSGEIFWDSVNNTLRIFNGSGVGGIQLAKANLQNVNNTVFLAKAQQAGLSGGGTVNSGDQGNIPYYASNGTTITALNKLNWTNSTNRLSVDGQIEVSAQKNFIRFHWDSLQDLNTEVDPVQWHGMIAHVHDTGRLYFAHAGAWVALPLTTDIPTAVNSFSNIAVSGQTTVVADAPSDTLTLVAGTGISLTTNAANDSITIQGQAINNSFQTIAVAGQSNIVADSTTDTLSFAAGTGITLTTNAANDTLTITAPTPNLSIDQLSDVDTTTTAPLVGQVLKWFGNSWRPATDATIGGTGTDADTLDGQDSAFFLNFSNLNNKPNIFTTFAVTGTDSLTPTVFNDTLTISAGPNITLVTDTVGKILTIDAPSSLSYDLAVENIVGATQIKLVDNFDVSTSVSFIAGSGITVVGNTSAKTITLSSSALTNSFANIAVSGNDTVIATSSAETLTLVAGTNVQLSTNNDTKSIVISSSGGGGGGAQTNSFNIIQVAGSNTVQAEQVNDTLTLIAGTGMAITTDNTADSITFTASVPRYQTMNVQGTAITATSVNTTFSFFQGSGISLTSDEPNKTMTIVNSGVTGITAGTGISVNNSTGSVTITNSISNHSSLTDVVSAVYPAYSGGGVNTNNFGTLTVDKTFLQAMVRLSVAFVFDGSNAGSGYRFDSHYGAEIDPTLYFITGTTVAFNLNVAGHPFQLLSSGGTVFTANLIHVATNGAVTTGANVQANRTSGTLYWNIPENPTSLVGFAYRCSIHTTTMGGNIVLKRLSTL